TLTEKNTPLVHQLCTRLDDLPFAIELAAARIASLPLEELVRRVDARFDLLTGGNRSALRRQQTLRATMDWSWALLTSDEQEALRQLAIFPSPFSLEVSEAACPNSLSLLPSLVEKSLIAFSPETGQYRLLETVREYVMEQGLGESGRTARWGYLRYACQQVEKAARNQFLPAERRLWHDTLEATYDNLRLALENALETSPSQALHLAANLWTFWWERGYWHEGLRTLQAVLEISTDKRLDHWVRAQLGAGILAYETGQYAKAHQYLTEAHKRARHTNDTWTEGEALRIQGLVRWNEGDSEEARTLYHQSQMCFQRSGHTAGQAGVLANLGHLTWNLGSLEESTQYNLQSRSLYQSLGDEVGLAETSAQLGLIARSQSDYGRAHRFFEEALTLRRKLGLRSGIVTVLHHLGVLAYLEHRYDDAQTRLQESVSLWRALGDPGWLALSLYYLGLVQRAQRTWAEAILSLTEALLLRRRQGTKRSIAGLQYALGTIWLEQRHYEDAQQALQESVQLRHEIGLPVFCGEALDALACLHARQDNFVRATAHLACATALRKGHDEVEEEHPYRDEAMTKTSEALSAEEWQCLWEESVMLSPLSL
ncbi:ATP-binding protein, partial [Armatimonas sp.]|uniref:ATP-binding protein n=1 Tax=Armatimonas sp. TaxID=1872638 RepID=UPI0037506BD7